MHHKITCGIKTMLRENKLRQCLESVADKGFSTVIVADDGPISDLKRSIYDHYAKILPLKLLTLPLDSGISKGRNAIVEHCDTDFLLMLDDDQIIPENILDLLTIVNANPTLGGISGVWDEYGSKRCGATNLFVRNKLVVKDIKVLSKKLTEGPLSFYLYDFIPNSTLFRTSCLRDVPWDPFYKIGSEHLDFYLTHKKLGKWKFAITPDVIITHDPREVTNDYHRTLRSNKNRLDESLQYFLKKWNVRSVHEIRKHISTPNISVPRRLLTYQLSNVGLPYEMARKISMHVPKALLPTPDQTSRHPPEQS
jgi:glycosyltransferase involved in cell wall biosynthesis